MTTTTQTSAVLPVRSIGAPRLLAGLDRLAVLDATAHQAVHGPLTPPGADRLLDWSEAVALSGRGGAGFPFAAKVRALGGGRPVVVVNGTESEPASWKDRTLLRRTPHLVLDGALAAAGALSAVRVVVAVQDALAEQAVRAALAERPEGRGVEVHRVVGGFVAGEARALVRALDGGPALPPGRRVLPVASGVGGAPTLLSNAETFAQLAVLLRSGPARFRATGPHLEPGTTLLTVGGAVADPGVTEVPLGTPLGIVLRAAGAVQGVRTVVVGGYHGAWLPASPDLPLTRSAVAAAGGTFGAGVVLALDPAGCELGELARVAGWLAAQSARQCGPCRFGLPALAADLDALTRGNGIGLAAAQRHAQLVAGRGACSHPDGAARFVLSGLSVLKDDIERHERHGTCGRPVYGLLPLGVS